METTRGRLRRRAFVGNLAAAGGGALLAGALPVRPARAAGSANGDIRLAVIGIGSHVKIGGKGRQDIRDWRKLSGVRIVALCDVDRALLDEEAADFARRGENVDAVTDLRRLLERKDIDAVSITTPNHWHALATVWACQAGKDVFLQKPASHNIFEGRQMVEAARRYGRIVLCTSGSREATGFHEALEWVRQGNLGPIRLIYGVNYKPRPAIGKVTGPQAIPPGLDYDLWSGPAPLQPLRRQHLHYDWHWDWLTGSGDLGNMGIHYLDGCRMATGQGLPRHVLSLGGRFGYDDDGQTPNSQLLYFDYAPAPVIFDVRGLPRNRALRAGDWKAAAMDDRHGEQTGLVIHCEGGCITRNKAFDKDDKLIREFKSNRPHLNQNFLDAVRSRKADSLVSTIEDAHLSAALVHMGNISYRLGRTAPSGEIGERIAGHKELAGAFERFQAHLAANEIDLQATPVSLGPVLTMNAETERFEGEFSEPANRLVTRNYRAPFVVPEKV